MVTGAIAAVAPPAAAANSVSVSVDAALQLAAVPATGVGVNVPVYDANMNSAATPGLLSTAGINTVRYPGGSHSDVYHWQTGTADAGAYVAPNTGFDAFMGTVRAAGAQPIITANYGSGTPQEAAAWVRYANVTKGYGVKYWEVGNEVYGNGEYSNGSGWEYDTHSSHSATTYADNLLQYISAMKAADPSIKIGAVLTTPGYWPDGIVGPGDTMDWNHTVLSIAGSKIDFAIVHAYPTSTSPADLLTKPQAQNPNIAGTVRSLINQYAGSNAPNVGIAVTEANAQAYLDTSPNGLFAPDNYLTWLENGAFNVDWWDLRNGTDCSKVTTVEGATDYNDGGMVSSASSCEPPLNTPFPAYYGIQMISRLGSPGDTLVKAASSSSLLSAHAVRRANGDVDVMLINKDPNNDATVNLSYTGFTPSSATPTVSSYLKNARSIGTTQSGSPTSQTVPAYGITVVQMHPTNAACRVVYNKNEWSGVMVGNVTVVNNGLGQVNGWDLGFNFPGDNTVTNSWNASASQSGPSINAANVSYDATVPQGGSVQWGFRATWSRSDADPSAFWFNGASCAIG
ncbi:cellulose binding domain-containing protein [Streptomyces sp. NPDC001817]|uniref:cellulose binding domain-containing protein n=1 Tax=Streptomyces sp. NPDC001817 TaxID=3154398 RepID=UPI00332D4B27